MWLDGLSWARRSSRSTARFRGAGGLRRRREADPPDGPARLRSRTQDSITTRGTKSRRRLGRQDRGSRRISGAARSAGTAMAIVDSLDYLPADAARSGAHQRSPAARRRRARALAGSEDRRCGGRSPIRATARAIISRRPLRACSSTLWRRASTAATCRAKNTCRRIAEGLRGLIREFIRHGRGRPVASRSAAKWPGSATPRRPANRATARSTITSASRSSTTT